MKIGIISRPRTVSTAVINSLAEKYKLNNEFEMYHVLVTSMWRPNKTIRNLDESAKLSYFENMMLSKTNEFFSADNFICKIWPCMFTYSSIAMLASWPLDSIKNKTLFDITRLFKIDQYDQLYFLDRDVYTTTASWVYSRKINVYHTDKKVKHMTPIITLDQMDYGFAKFHVLEYILQHKLKQMLIDKQIAYVDISNNYNDYINESVLRTKKSEHDYPSLITDYSKLHDSITEWLQYFTENTKDWQFT